LGSGYILVDTGPLVAAFDPEDADHEASVKFFESNTRPMVTCDFVITEVSYFLGRFGSKKTAIHRQSQFLELIADSAFITRMEVSNDDLLQSKRIMEKYSDLPSDLADAILVNYANKNNVFDVISIDQDFSIYRGEAKQPFKNLFYTRDE
jgi:uncharacterized protein